MAVSATSFPGLGSGIDATRLAKSIYDQITLTNTIRKDRLSNLSKQETSLNKLRSLLTSVSSSVDSARTINGGASAKSALSSDTSVVQVSAGASSAAGTFQVNVQSLASNATGSFNRTFSSANAFVVEGGVSGQVNFTIGGGSKSTSFAVNVDETTTVQGFVESFNAQSQGKASASLVNVGTAESPAFKIVFSTNAVGVTEGSLTVSPSNNTLFGPHGLQGQTVSQATNAQFTVSGVSGTIERESNTSSDVVPGVTLQLKKTGSSTVSVSESSSAAASRLGSFASAFNELVKYANTEDRVTTTTEGGELVNKFGTLARTNADDDAVASLRSAIASATADDGTSLAALGISTNRDGTLNFDQKKFEAAFAENSAAANQAVTKLADTIGGVGGTVDRYTGYAHVIDQAINAGKAESVALNDTISQVERRAKSQEELVLKQFQSLDRLSAQLSQSASFISNLFRL